MVLGWLHVPRAPSAMGCMITWTCLSTGRRTGTSEDRYGYIYGERGSVTIEPVTIRSESERWVVLQMYRGCLIVLPREQFKQSLRRGKWWKRAADLRARQPDVETSADLRRAVKGQP
jgi:hypothetical protein